jgi:hypothetical protein
MTEENKPEEETLTPEQEKAKMKRDMLREQLALAHDQIQKMDNGTIEVGDLMANVHKRAQDLTGLADLKNVSDEQCDKLIQELENGEKGVIGDE